MMQNSFQWLKLGAVALCAAGILGCATQPPPRITVSSTQPFGKTREGVPVELYTLRNTKGAEARICTYGGTVVSLKVPDRNGNLGDVVLGYDNLEGYLTNSPYFGCLIGRYANRIAKAKFTLDGHEYRLAANNGVNNLHSGPRGFDKVVWTARPTATSEGPALQLTYLSHDGEEGFPGNLLVTAIYTLTEDNALKVQFSATTDKPTVVSLTHHSYFNLLGQGDILSHEVMLNADKYTPVDSTSIPTGELAPVAGTPFDFRKPTAIGARIGQDNEQLRIGNGYDHNWVCAKPLGKPGLIARVYEPTSGRVLEVFSDEPGLQFYTGNSLDGTITGKGGQVYVFRSGFCIEPQHYPDSPNHPKFPSVVLKPGQTFRSTMIFKFSVR
jgi:aldose 1-epimerase